MENKIGKTLEAIGIGKGFLNRPAIANESTSGRTEKEEDYKKRRKSYPVCTPFFPL